MSVVLAVGIRFYSASIRGGLFARPLRGAGDSLGVFAMFAL